MALGHTNTSKGNVTAPTTQRGIVAIYYLGTTSGILMGGSISDRIGRIRTVTIHWSNELSLNLVCSHHWHRHL